MADYTGLEQNLSTEYGPRDIPNKTMFIMMDLSESYSDRTVPNSIMFITSDFTEGPTTRVVPNSQMFIAQDTMVDGPRDILVLPGFNEPSANGDKLEPRQYPLEVPWTKGTTR